MFARRVSAILCCSLFLLVCSNVLAKDKEPKTYPEQGRVIANRTAEQARTLPVYTDPYGKTHGGMSIISRLPVFRIETETKFYEIEGRKKQQLALGDTIQFRLEKQWAYVQQGDKEQKFRLVGTELKPSK
jgi:hypothetical protein